MKKRILFAALALLTTTSLAACGNTGAAANAESGSTVTIGTTDGAEAYWGIMKEKLAAEDIDLQVRNFTDGVQINTATQQGQLDINLFQHLKFLSQFNVNNKGTLTPVGATAIYPLGLYSTKYDEVGQLPADSQVAIPSDPTNQARALLNLQTAALLTLKDGGNSLSTPAEIETSKVKVLPVDANQTVAALAGSASAAVINNAQAQKGGLKDDDIIFKDDPDAAANGPYINVFVVKAENQDDPRWAKIVEAFHTPEVEASVRELNDGNLVFKAASTGDDLRKILDVEEAAIRAK